MELKATQYEVNAHVATVTLNRPHRRNAWTGRMHTEYRWCMQQAEQNPEVRVVVVTGAGDAFCVGGDSQALAGHAEKGVYDDGVRDTLATPGHGIDPRLDHEFAWQWGLRIPIIAAINGACAGVALALACFADLRITTTTAKFTTAAPQLGLPAEYGLSFVLPRIVGLTVATDLLFTGRVFTGADALLFGLVNDAVEPADFASTVDAFATRLATGVGPTALTVTKRQLYRDLLHHDPGDSVEYSKARFQELVATADYREGVAAFREKRPPVF